MKYEHKSIYSNCSLQTITDLRNQGWKYLLTHKYNGVEYLVFEREIKQRTNKTTPIERRKSIFKGRVACYLSTYSQSLLNEFYGYWSEHGEKDTKMRFEKEKSFDIERRLKTWKRNAEKFNKPNTKSVNSSW
jgi:hypothetical protein